MPDALRIDASSALAGFKDLGRAGAVGAARALKRTVTTTATFLRRSVAKDMGLAVGVVGKSMTTSIREHEGVARIAATGSPIPLIHFKARGPEPSRGKGRVTYNVGQGRKELPGGFITTVGIGGHRGVFVRRTKARLPIDERFGPSVAHVCGKYLPEAADVAQEALLKNVAHEIRFALNRAG